MHEAHEDMQGDTASARACAQGLRQACDEKRAQDYAQRLSRMLQLETIHRDGCEPVFEEFRALLVELFPHVYESCEFENVGGSLLYRWRGADGGAGEALALMSHHDVVEAGEGWTHDPFGGEIADGRVWGRGALDIKGNLFCMLQAVEELAASAFEPACDIYVISSDREEIGGNDLIVDLLRERGVKIGLLLDEGSPFQLFPLAGFEGEGAFVSLAEKGSAKVRCIARGSGGHPMLPGRRSPLPRLGAFMAEIDRDGLLPLPMSPAVSAFFACLAQRAEGDARDALLALAACKEVADAELIDALDPGLRDVLGTTVAFTLAHGSDVPSTMPTAAWVQGNIRIAPGNTVDQVMEALHEVAARHDIEIELEKSGEPSPAAKVHGEGMKRIERAVNLAAPGLPTVPFLLAGGTDTKHFLGFCECVRFTALFISAEQQRSIHGIDENVNIDTLVRGVDFFKAIIRDDGCLADDCPSSASDSISF